MRLPPRSALVGRHSDVLAAAALMIFTLAESRTAGRFTGATWADVGLAVLAAAPLAWRRRRPLAVLLVMLVATVTYAAVWALPQSAGLLLALMLAVYSVPRHRVGRARVVGAVVLVAALPFLEWRDPTTHSVGEAAPSFLLVLVAWIAGVVARRSFERSRQLAELTEQLRAEKEETARLAVVSERLHIARELHDVLAHSISVMVVQVGAARLAGGALSGPADAALRSAEQVGRQSLADMRRLLTVLRDDPDQLLLPQPGVAALPELLASSAPHVSLDIDPALPEVPAGVDLVIYRIVQEATTNLVKHVPGARASVHVAHVDGGISVIVDNDPPAARRPSMPPAPGSGHGLAGMAERVAMYGGKFEAGLRDDQGFTVRAFLPLQPGEAPANVTVS